MMHTPAIDRNGSLSMGEATVPRSNSRIYFCALCDRTGAPPTKTCELLRSVIAGRSDTICTSYGQLENTHANVAYVADIDTMESIAVNFEY